MSNRLRRLRAERDRGSAPVEFAIGGVLLVLVLATAAIAVRISLAGQDIAGVAGNAARQASLARSAADAVHVAHTTAVASLTAHHLHCIATPTVTVDASGFSAPLGTNATITVDVTCVVRLSDVAVPGLPGSRTLHDRGTSPLDPFRTVPLGLTDPDARAPLIRVSGGAT